MKTKIYFRRIISLVIIAATTFCLASCGSNYTKNDQTTAQSETTTFAQSQEKERNTEKETTDAPQEETEPAVETVEYPVSRGTFEGSVLRIGWPGDVTQFVPYVDTGSLTKKFVRNVYDGLINYADSNSSIEIPGLAESWDVSDDAKTYTFHLRENAYFHNGKHFTSQDVIDNLDLYKSISGPDVTFAPIINYKAVDEYTVIFELDEPWSAISYYLSSMYFPICDVDAYNESGNVWQACIGTGPYMLTEMVEGVSWKLEAFQKYWDTPAEIETIEVYRFADDSSRFNSFLAGAIDDIDTGLSQVQIQTLQLSGTEYTYGEVPLTNVYSMWMNTSRDVFSDVRVRQAVSMLINREEVDIAMFGQGMYKSVDCPWSDNVSGYVSGTVYDYDPDKGLDLLKQAGVEPSDLSFSILTVSSSGVMQIGAENIQAQLSQYGINVTIDGLAFFSCISSMFAGQFDAVFFNVDAYSADPVLCYTHPLLTGTFNTARVCDGMPELFAQFEDLLGKAANVTDKNEQRELLEQCTQLTYENALVVPCGRTIMHFATVKGFEPSRSPDDGQTNFYYWKIAD